MLPKEKGQCFRTALFKSHPDNSPRFYLEATSPPRQIDLTNLREQLSGFSPATSSQQDAEPREQQRQ